MIMPVTDGPAVAVDFPPFMISYHKLPVYLLFPLDQDLLASSQASARHLGLVAATAGRDRIAKLHNLAAVKNLLENRHFAPTTSFFWVFLAILAGTWSSH